MRSESESDLAVVDDLLVTMTESVRSAMADATTAVLTADRKLAVTVAARDAEVNALRDQVENLVVVAIARHASVSGNLRALFTAVQVATDVERMGDLAAHVARTTLQYHPRPAVPPDLRALFVQIGRTADEMAARAADVLAIPDAGAAAELERDDDTMDDLHQRLLSAILDRNPTLDVAAGVQLVLLARYYERFADHCVNIGQRVAFRVSGLPVR